VLAPFHGVRYAQDKVSDLAEVTSPPYDVIAHDIEDQLMAADPHNVVRLILPRLKTGRSGDQYREAARLLQEWQDEQILCPDSEPALYVYEQALAPAGPGGPGQTGNGSAGQGGNGSAGQGGNGSAGQGGPGGPGQGGNDSTGQGGNDGTGRGGGEARVIQRGLIGALRLEPLDAGIVLPHEGVAPGPVAGRRQLMEATQANLEPIFLLYDTGAVSAASCAAEAAAARTPLEEAVTSDGLRHRLWAITDPAELAAIAADLAPARPIIADGHHRYSAYLDLQRRRQAAGDGPGPWDYGLALLVDARTYPPHVGAIHRVIPELEPAAAADLAKAAFRVTALPGGPARLPDAVNALEAASQQGVAFLVAGGDSVFLLTEPDPLQADAAMPAGASARWRSLPAAVLQELLVARIWGIPDNEQRVRFVHNDPAAAVRAADRAGGTAVICTPMSVADVYALAAHGEVVPRKSTSFDPKPRTGLVMRMFADS
jgi:uncharacterized protein (DUF1015 family)